MGCFSGRLMSSASDQKLFCKLSSPFSGSFDEFVEEKVISPSYSSAILTPPLRLFLRQPCTPIIWQSPASTVCGSWSPFRTPPFVLGGLMWPWTCESGLAGFGCLMQCDSGDDSSLSPLVFHRWDVGTHPTYSIWLWPIPIYSFTLPFSVVMHLRDGDHHRKMMQDNNDYAFVVT